MSKTKVCSKCSAEKDLSEFYFYNNYHRSDCKKCCIKINSVKNKSRPLPWKKKFSNIDEKRAYMRDYYAKNKESYKAYRKKFLEKHPDYYKTKKRSSDEEAP